MKKINEHLISTRAFVLFDAAARCGSFSKAASSLNLGQPAISHGIKQLEHLLGVVLFHRHRSGVKLTDAGQLLAEKVSEGLATIREGVEQVQQMPGSPQRVTLSVSTSLASYWLMPKIARLKTAFPDIDLRCITNDDDRDLLSERYDLSIPLGGGDWPGFRKWLFAREEVFPVCSPGYASAMNGRFSQQALSSQNLLHLEEAYVKRLDWQEWFHRFRIKSTGEMKGYSSNDYSIIVQAALDGQGVALGWKHIVSPLVERQELVRLGRQSIKTEQPFYLISSNSTPLTQSARLIRDWLVAESNP